MTAQKFVKSYNDIKTLMNSYVKPSGELDEKYGIMVFKAKKGNYAIVKRIVNEYIRNSKKIDPDIIVMEDTDDNLVKSWLIGNKDKISQMVNDSFKQQPF
jgi:hypothetical protein